MCSGTNGLVVWALQFKFSCPMLKKKDGSKICTTFHATEVEKLSTSNLSPVGAFAV